MRINFEEVSLKATKRWIDEAGKKRQKTKKFYQTISPFNKNKDGTVKTRDQILEEVTKERNMWMVGNDIVNMLNRLNELTSKDPQ